MLANEQKRTARQVEPPVRTIDASEVRDPAASRSSDASEDVSKDASMDGSLPWIHPRGSGEAVLVLGEAAPLSAHAAVALFEQNTRIAFTCSRVPPNPFARSLPT